MIANQEMYRIVDNHCVISVVVQKLEDSEWISMRAVHSITLLIWAHVSNLQLSTYMLQEIEARLQSQGFLVKLEPNHDYPS